MNRLIPLLALVALLVACTGQGDGTTDTATQPATTSSPANAGSPEATGDANEGTAGSTSGGSASAACSDAFASLADMQITSITELGDLPDEVEPTVESCESVDDWIAGAQEAIGDDVNPNTARLLLRMHCDQPSMSRTEVCRELASS